VNTDALESGELLFGLAGKRVLEIQRKLHRWAREDPQRVFDDLFNLVADPAFLLIAWDRVRGNRGSRTAGVDGATAWSIEASRQGVAGFLEQLRADLKARTFQPLPVRERMIPKTGGKLRRLGIPTVRDRVVQASLKLVLEPIFEADFDPCSYGFRPNRRAQDAIEEIRYLAARAYEWVFEGDIAACFDEIDHSALMDRVRRRVEDKRVLSLIKAFLKAGVLTEHGANRDTVTGTPQGGILSPLLANIALSVLDEHFTEFWQRECGDQRVRATRRRYGHPNYRLIRYADDFVVMVHGTWQQTESLRGVVSDILAHVGLRLADEKTRTVHIDEGFDFLGFCIRRDRRRGSDLRFIYTYPSKRSVERMKRKVKGISVQGTKQSFDELLRQMARALRGWAMYFRHGASKATFSYLGSYQWHRLLGWLKRKHRTRGWRWLRRRYSKRGWWPEYDGVRMFNPADIPIVRYRYRGANIPTPWTLQGTPA
jgi:RNA-directed DNA polymerase